MLVPTEPFDQFPHTAPMIIDMSNGFTFVRKDGFLLAWNDPEETPATKRFRASVHREDIDSCCDRVPVFENLAVNPKRHGPGYMK